MSSSSRTNLFSVVLIDMSKPYFTLPAAKSIAKLMVTFTDEEFERLIVLRTVSKTTGQRKDAEESIVELIKPDLVKK